MAEDKAKEKDSELQDLFNLARKHNWSAVVAIVFPGDGSNANVLFGVPDDTEDEAIQEMLESARTAVDDAAEQFAIDPTPPTKSYDA